MRANKSLMLVLKTPGEGHLPILRTLRLALIALVCAFLVAGCKTPEKTGSTAVDVTAPPKQFVSPKTGKTFTYVLVPDTDEEHEKFEIPRIVFGAPSKDNFLGTDRGAAKTSISSGPQVTRTDVADLLAHLPDTDENMMSHNPPISKSATSGRVSEEEQNVVVEAGFIYAVAKEADNDYHIILGTAPGAAAQFINVEVSGLPKSGASRVPLKQVRDKFQNHFGAAITGSGYHKWVGDPVPVRVTGSLFYDIDHPPGAVGPTGLKPTTAWEIHPVTDIEFEP